MTTLKVYLRVKLMVRASGNSSSLLCRKQTSQDEWEEKKYLGHSVNFHLACLDSSIIKLPPNESYIFILNMRGRSGNTEIRAEGKKLFHNKLEGRRKKSFNKYSSQKSCFPSFFFSSINFISRTMSSEVSFMLWSDVTASRKI